MQFSAFPAENYLSLNMSTKRNRSSSPPPLFGRKPSKKPKQELSSFASSGKRKPERDPLWFNFHDEVVKLGAAQLHGHTKRDFTKKKFESEGRKPLKTQKAPFTMLQGMRKKQKERDVRRRERLKDSGMLRDFQKNLGKRESTSRQDFIKRVTHGDREGLLSGSRALKASAGTFANGTLRLSQSHIDSVHRQMQTKKKSNAPAHQHRGNRSKGGHKKGGKGGKHKKR